MGNGGRERERERKEKVEACGMRTEELTKRTTI